MGFPNRTGASTHDLTSLWIAFRTVKQKVNKQTITGKKEIPAPKQKTPKHKKNPAPKYQFIYNFQILSYCICVAFDGNREVYGQSIMRESK